MTHNHQYRFFVDRIKEHMETTFYCTCHRLMDAPPSTPNLVKCFCGKWMVLMDYGDIPWDGYLQGGIECPQQVG